MQNFVSAVALMVGLAASPVAAAVVTQEFEGNECGQGTPFHLCVDPKGSPAIAKFDFDDEGGGVWTISSLFADTVLATMFDLTWEGGGETGSWTYDKCEDCPFITSFAVKAGDSWLWFYLDPLAAMFAGDWWTPGGKDISHITFFDTKLSPDPQVVIPLPASGLLLLGGIAALGAVRNRRQRTKV